MTDFATEWFSYFSLGPAPSTLAATAAVQAGTARTGSLISR